MTVSPKSSAGETWETEDAPHVTRRSIVVSATIYGVWLLFLAGLAAQRWLGSLQ
ncbi:MAG: hypothetical protein ACE5F9_05225 [Phycisphaerae bacterium]